jgi:hypothetical protein
MSCRKQLWHNNYVPDLNYKRVGNWDSVQSASCNQIENLISWSRFIQAKYILNHNDLKAKLEENKNGWYEHHSVIDKYELAKY